MTSLQDRLDAYWTRRAPVYDEAQRRPQRWAEDQRNWAEVWAWALPEPPATVLDLGTGSGHVALLLSRLGYDVTGVDSSEGMLARARRHAEEARASGVGAPRLVHGDAVTPVDGVVDGDVAAVTCRYLAWTLRDPVGAMSRWRQLLRPGGVLALVDSTWFTDGLEGSPPEFVAAYGAALDELPLARATSIEPTAAAVREAGFRDVRVRELTTVLETDLRHGAAPGHSPRLQYLVTGRR